jgi:hypothetical protein
MEEREAFLILTMLESNVNKWFLLVNHAEEEESFAEVHKVHAVVPALDMEKCVGLVKKMLNHINTDEIKEFEKDHKIVVGLAKLVFKGHFNFFLEFLSTHRSILPWSDQVEVIPMIDVLRSGFTILFGELPRWQSYDVYTWGSNNNMAIGHSGTLPKWPVKLPVANTSREVTNSHIDKVEMGLFTTVFLPKNRRHAFISGKIGAKHSLTPELVEFREPVVCAAVGAAHAVLCTKRVIFWLRSIVIFTFLGVLCHWR